MTNVINILTTGGVGATFLDWTINYLTSKTLHKWYIKSNNQLVHCNTQISKTTIPSYPLIHTTKTAHKHKTSLIDTSQIKNALTLLKHNNTVDGLFTIYSVYGKDNFINNSTNYLEVINQTPSIKQNIVFEFNTSDIDTVYLWKFDREQVIEGVQESQLSVWDRREILSLRYHRSMAEQLLNEDVATHPRTVILNFRDYITKFDQTVNEIIQKLNLQIVNSRIDNWKCVYADWKKMVGVRFIVDLDLIVDNIVNNVSYDLSMYDMSLGKEIVICKRLLFEYNLTLRMHGILTMPLNTCDWHTLLEENVYHDLSSFKA